MAMLRIAVSGETPRLHDPERGRDAPALTVEAIRAAAPELAPRMPVVILLHGYRYDPHAAPLANPHDTLFAFEPLRPRTDRWQKTESWPRGLGFTPEDTTGREGLCIAFGWSARPRRRFGRFCAAYANAEQAGRALLRTVEMVARVHPGRPIDFMAHSLGARVVLCAMRLAAQRRRHDLLDAMGRVIMLGPAELAVVARGALARVDAVARRGGPCVFAMLARENDVFDALLEHFAPAIPMRRKIGIGARGLGRGRNQCRRNWIDLQIDHPETRRWLAERGAVIGGEPRRACHWGVYNRPGTLALYAAILRDRARWSIPVLREEGVPEDLEPRWSRLPRFLRRRLAPPRGDEVAAGGRAAT